MITENKRKSSLLVPADLCFSGLVRKTSQALFQHLEMSDIDTFRLVLVMDEVFMNAVQHGSDKSSSVHITYLFEKGKDIRITIEDEGTGEDCCAKDLKEKMQQEFQYHNPEKTSGRGLAQIALNIADEITIEESQFGGIKVEFTKDL